MFIKKNKKVVDGKEYTQHVLVESVRTPKGPRHKSIVSLGDLKPRPKEDWLKLVHMVEEALIGQMNIFAESDEEVLRIVDKIKRRKEYIKEDDIPESITINPMNVETDEHKEFGASFVFSYFWDLMKFDEVLQGAGLSSDAIKLTLISAANRLIHPLSDYGMVDWAKKRSYICELSGFDSENLNDDRLYRLLDVLYPGREVIERELYNREKNLFNLEGSLLFVDFTSFYFEGSCVRNNKAKRGYSRDKRPDCKQFVLGAAIGREGFPIASEIFEGNRNDSPAFPIMLSKINERVNVEGRTLIFDRGIATSENMEYLESGKKKYYWIVACRSWEGVDWLEALESTDWKVVPLTGKVAGRSDPFVTIKLLSNDKEQMVLVSSEGRKEKDRAIRLRQDKKMVDELDKLSNLINSGKLKDREKIWQKVGRLRERYPRVGRYFKIELKEGQGLFYEKDEEKLRLAEKSDGIYLLKTNRMDLDFEEIFRAYSLLTRIEKVFKDLKGPVRSRPNRHHRGDRAEAHIFQSVLALHILTAIELRLKENGDCRSWEKIRDILSTHQACSVILPAENGQTYKIKNISKMNEEQHQIYQNLGIIKKKRNKY